MAKYHVSWHAKGQAVAEGDIHEFVSLQEALIFLRNELRWLAEDLEDPTEADRIFRLAQRLETGPWDQSQGEFDCGPWVYNIKRDGVSLFESGVIW